MHLITENKKNTGTYKTWSSPGLAPWKSSAYVVVPYRLLFLNLRISSGKLFHFSDIYRDYVELMFVVEPNGGGRESCEGLFYCLNTLQKLAFSFFFSWAKTHIWKLKKSFKLWQMGLFGICEEILESSKETFPPGVYQEKYI